MTESSENFGNPSRRDFIHGMVAAASLPLLSGHSSASADSDAFDQALEILAQTGPEFGGGLANHGPMAAEALVAMGRPKAVLPFLERYKRQLQSPPEATRPIARDTWRETLGDHSRLGDWIALFNRELKEAPWRSVLNEWAVRLAPGLAAAAAHGLIRTAHAARQLAARENELRRRELAEGLGYWAACYQPLPVAKDATAMKLKPSEAIKQVELLPVAQRGGGSIVGGLRRLDNFAPFAKVYGLVDSSMDASRFVSDLTETAAGLYLTNSRGRASIAFIHAVTAPSAIRMLLPHIKPEIAPSLLHYGWQTAAGIYAAFGTQPAVESSDQQKPDRQDLPDLPNLIDRAVATNDEHGIKFAEACLREYAVNPKPVYVLATRHASDRMTG